MRQNDGRKNYVLGITGGMGSGKSTVTNILRNLEPIEVLDGDLISREIVNRPEILRTLIQFFGTEIVDLEGRLDRKKLGEIVFSGGQERVWALNRIMHKPIGLEIKRRVEEMQGKKILLDVALPVYEGFVDTCHEIWCVISNRELRVQRILQRGGLSLVQVNQRLSFQPTDHDYQSIADKVIENNGNLVELEDRVRTLWNNLKIIS